MRGEATKVAFVDRAEGFSPAGSLGLYARRRAEAFGYHYEARHPKGTRRTNRFISYIIRRLLRSL